MHRKSEKTGSSPAEDAVHPTEWLATIYHAFGIDPETIVYNPETTARVGQSETGN